MHRFILAALLGCASLPIAGMAADAAGANQDPAFTGFIFVPRVEEVNPAGALEPASQIDAARVPALADPAAIAEIRQFIGLPLSDVLLEAMRTAITKYYGSIGRPFVSVVVPRQDVTSGVVQVVVIEGRVGQLKIEGNRWFGEDQYRSNLNLQPGGPIDNNTLQADLDWINRNQYRRATAVASQGTAVGATDLTIRTEERLPLSVTSGFDNSGNQGTGLYRIYTGIDWGNALWRGDNFNYRFTTTPEIRPLYQHAFSYSTDLPWRDTLTLSLGIVDSTSATPGSAIATRGHSFTAGLRYQIPLRDWRTTTQSLTFGYDF